jgi:hypothetical protein
LTLDPRHGSVLACRGKDGHRREAGMDDWGFEQLERRHTRGGATAISYRTSSGRRTRSEIALEGVPLNVIQRRSGGREVL